MINKDSLNILLGTEAYNARGWTYSKLAQDISNAKVYLKIFIK